MPVHFKEIGPQQGLTPGNEEEEAPGPGGFAQEKEDLVGRKLIRPFGLVVIMGPEVTMDTLQITAMCQIETAAQRNSLTHGDSVNPFKASL
jgi:hypothetical protein